KRVLEAVIEASGSSRLRYVDHLEGEGALFADQACRLGLEGAVSKRRDAPYRSGRSRSWQKMKCLWQQEFVVIGFCPATNDAGAVGSLVLGAGRGDRLVRVGQVGTGFTEAQRRALHRELAPHVTADSPVGERDPDVRWVRPGPVVEVAFNGWTGGGRLR